jgi:glycosyltransferase involved in cell wall biosynthesis
MSRFSICIPTWEQHGSGLKHLQELKNSIDKQTFTDYEIVVSDHSINDDILNFCTDTNIRYYRYELNRGNSCSNINNAIRYATGEIIKVIFQDDMMYSDNCLDILNNAFTPEVEWIVTGSNHTTDGKIFYREFIPQWNNALLSGNNTIGCPSLLSFRNGNELFFDNGLTMLMDVEYYYQLYSKFGHPLIIPDICITTRIHEHQISNLYNYDNLQYEVEYIKNKYERI